MAKYRILVIDDDGLMREYVQEAMLRAGYDVDTANGGAEGLRLLEAQSPDLVITDLKMTPMDGLEVLRQVKLASSTTPVVVMTAYGTIETAVTALKAGASDYILKPFTPDTVELVVSRALDTVRMSAENAYLRRELAGRNGSGGMVGKGSDMRSVQEQIQRIADSRATVLVRGESGTGKELAARAIHESGNRRNKPFIRVNCAALSAGILESELFGHEKGSFTGAHERKIGRFELADGGSLLLDEISEIGLELQPKLLRALQEREFERVGGTRTIQVDTRIIATSNRDLEQAVREGSFREDLFFRLNVITLALPPLRQRKEDIPELMDHFLQRFNRENGRTIRGFSDSARQAFLDYPWPGNVRELQNAIERAVVLSSGIVLDIPQFAFGSGIAAGGGKLTPGMTVAEMERQLIFETLAHCGQNRTKAAELLDISVRTLRNKLKEYGAASAEDE